MIVVMRKGAGTEAVQAMVARVEELGMKAHVIVGTERTVVAGVGDENEADRQTLASYEDVEQVVAILAPYKIASRETKPEPTVVRAGSLTVGRPFEHQGIDDFGLGKTVESDRLAAGGDRRKQILRTGRRQDQKCPLGRLLERLQKGVRRLRAHHVRLRNDDHPSAAVSRCLRYLSPEFTNRRDLDLLCTGDLYVMVRIDRLSRQLLPDLPYLLIRKLQKGRISPPILVLSGRKSKYQVKTLMLKCVDRMT